MKESIFVESSGNVFADLGLPDADIILAKTDLAIEIGQIIRIRGWSQDEAATILGLTQAQLSGLLRGKFREFSEEKMMDCLRQCSA